MKSFDIDWKVIQLRDGCEEDGSACKVGGSIVAKGQITKEGNSVDELRAALTTHLSQAFPEHEMGATFELTHVYDISIQETVTQIHS